MRLRFVWLSALFAFVLVSALTLGACGGVASKSLSRGDQYAEAGQWDDAARAYEEALKLDPENEEAKLKLRQARSKQAGERLARAEALEARGELIAALQLLQKSVSLDSDNAKSQQALTRVSNAAVTRAESLKASGKLREAFELVAAVLLSSPNHPRAGPLDVQLRESLAQQAFKKALVLIESGKLGNALVHLAACLGYHPKHAEARMRFGQVKLQLEESLRFWVVIGELGGAGKNAKVARAVDPRLLRASFDERLLLHVTQDRPEKGQPSGVELRAVFDRYAHNLGRRAIQKSCDYVCGTEYKPNPALDSLRRELASLDSKVSQHDQRISQLERRLYDEQKEQSREQTDADKKRADLDKVREKLADCRAKKSGDDSSSNSCWSEESSVNSKKSSYESAQRDVESARRDVERANDNLRREKDARASDQKSRADASQKLLRTPKQIEVKKYCPFNYAVQEHDRRSQVMLKLSMTRLGDDSVILRDEQFSYQSNARDTTHRAHPGRCREVARADPLNLPNEGQLRTDLAKKVIADLRKKVLTSYDSYRAGFLTAARRSETSGLTEEATESYVRYILTAPNQIESAKQIQKFFRKTAGLGNLEGLWKL